MAVLVESEIAPPPGWGVIEQRYLASCPFSRLVIRHPDRAHQIVFDDRVGVIPVAEVSGGTDQIEQKRGAAPQVLSHADEGQFQTLRIRNVV